MDLAMSPVVAFSGGDDARLGHTGILTWADKHGCSREAQRALCVREYTGKKS